MRLLAVLALLSCAAPHDALAEDVIAGLNQTRISISADFDGSELLIFGAIKREAPLDRSERPEIIVTVEGPSERLAIHKKARIAGIWVNAETVEIDAAPSFYSVSTSAPLDRILRQTDDMRHAITLARAIRQVGAPAEVASPEDFSQALIRLRAGQNLYQTNIGDVRLREATLFDTAVALPANLVEGVYTARIFLTRGGRVVSTYSTAIEVEKVGLERFLYNLAHRQALIYGLLSLAIAIAAGWGASAVFRYVRG
ncbi:hypothetical protein OCGS_0194 [Oceaniovalibus guishaninsula JLT2003]|uniref:Transmembrane protein n=1 Tax=Oceaniovalibus guishaninsula JLT2003 TaxID=1231392 RepID=K2HGL3_9RHOB|nr:TIGR02186 family protein [Oceaniovalibus guishaninsula]EKE45577.1 hypothetical protein OCGS_0194 [Oceaniovalibus guishaninsula JLT2003]